MGETWLEKATIKEFNEFEGFNAPLNVRRGATAGRPDTGIVSAIPAVRT